VNRAASHPNQLQMPQAHSELPTSGFAIEVDGRLKTQFSTPEGARSGAEELKRRFPMLQVRIYDAAANAFGWRTPGRQVRASAYGLLVARELRDHSAVSALTAAAALVSVASVVTMS